MTRSTHTRRAALRTAALAAGGTVLGLLGADGAAGAPGGDAASFTARLYANDFHPNARVRVVSKPLEYVPTTEVQSGEAFISDMYWRGYETRVLRYANTGERVLFFPPTDAPVREGRAYRTGRIRSTEELDPGIVAVGLESVSDGSP
jgi:hypothetical protein